jgi:hypothetical protein
MRSDWGHAGVGAYGINKRHGIKRRGILRSRWFVAGTLSVATALAAGPAAAQPPSKSPPNPVEILFLGNSFTHGRYVPALSYNAGPGNSTNNDLVHDLLCPSLTAAGACSSGAEAVAAVTPTAANTPGANLLAQLNYLQANPSSQYTEVGPFGGVAGVFLQFTKEAGLHYNVSLVAVSSATLSGYLGNKGNELNMLPLIANAKWDHVVMHDQSFRPLPTTVTVNGVGVPTRGVPTGFQSGVNGLISAIQAADAAANKKNAAITLTETQPMASYGFTSSNPDAPIFGSSTVAQNGGNPAFAPYVGATDPLGQMASDLHNAYTGEASAYNTANPNGSHVDVALVGDAWLSAIHLGIAVENPYLPNNPRRQVDLWDSNPLLSCCTTPIGYHPSSYGVYLDALVIFYRITGVDPRMLHAEMDDDHSRPFQSSAAHALGISSRDARLLAFAARETVDAGMPICRPHAAPTWPCAMLKRHLHDDDGDQHDGNQH